MARIALPNELRTGYRLFLFLAVVAITHGCSSSSHLEADAPKGNIEVVANCLQRKAAEYWGIDPSSTSMIASRNDQRTLVDMKVQESDRILAKYRIEQLPDSIKVEGGIIDPSVVIQSSADAKAALDRRRKIVDPCLTEGGF